MAELKKVGPARRGQKRALEIITTARCNGVLLPSGLWTGLKHFKLRLRLDKYLEMCPHGRPKTGNLMNLWNLLNLSLPLPP
jgi:hypothetical protein